MFVVTVAVQFLVRKTLRRQLKAVQTEILLTPSTVMLRLVLRHRCIVVVVPLREVVSVVGLWSTVKHSGMTAPLLSVLFSVSRVTLSVSTRLEVARGVVSIGYRWTSCIVRSATSLGLLGLMSILQNAFPSLVTFVLVFPLPPLCLVGCVGRRIVLCLFGMFCSFAGLDVLGRW